MEIGCGTGDLLASLNPKIGYGYDISREMIKRAEFKYRDRKNLHFSNKILDPNHYTLDAIYMSDVVEHLENPKVTFLKLSRLMGPRTVFINTMMNPIWIPVEFVYNLFGWKMPEGPHRRIRYKDIKILCEQAGLKIIKHDYRLLMPIRIPVVTNFLNRYLERFLKRFAFIEYFVAVRS